MGSAAARETLACGTGACASAVAAVLNGYCDMNTEISVLLTGGELRITYTDETVYMEGCGNACIHRRG